MDAEIETSPPTGMGTVFESDALLTSQFFAVFRRDGGLVRERLLMLAVLEDAIDTYRRYARARGERHHLFDEVRDWVDSADRSWLFSFESICDTLGLDAAHVRRGLRASIARQSMRRAGRFAGQERRG